LQIVEPVISKHDTTTQEQDLMEKGMIWRWIHQPIYFI
jgi:hypothetical protein